ncbi:S49 family peptidase [Halodesulfovibrio aestuarii]|uniref:S49 family peptidase n=1 Tax=Halodesulfovibrio aestuarii TaxID=126333 RepID=A0ABV4JUP6_9BACT
MHDFFGPRLLCIQPEFLPTLVGDMRKPSNGALLFSRRREESEKPPYELVNGVAVISVKGAMSQEGGFWSTGYSIIRDKVQAALNDSGVSRILLSFNSPGGTEGGLFELADWLREVSQQKTMAAYADTLMCSAAYLLGAATGTIYAPRMATVGSVGVVWTHINYAKLNEEWGFDYTYLTGGEMKASGNPNFPLSDTDRTYWQSRVDHCYKAFQDVCTECMSLDAKNVTEWADGKIFHGDQAKELGLVTGIVRDRDAAISSILATTAITEEEMDLKNLNLEALKESDPQGYAALSAHFGASAQGNSGKGEDAAPATPSSAQANAQPAAAKIDPAVEGACALMEANGDKDGATRMRTLSAAGFDLKQITALAGLGMTAPVATKAEANEDSGADSNELAIRQELLTAIQGADSAPVGSQPQNKAQTDQQKEAALVASMVETASRGNGGA